MDRNILIRTILPHPSPLPLGEGELSSDDWRGFMGREQVRKEQGTFHERLSERGCVEDQPQRVATFAAAAAGAPLPRAQPRSVCQSVRGPHAFDGRSQRHGA